MDWTGYEDDGEHIAGHNQATLLRIRGRCDDQLIALEIGSDGPASFAQSLTIILPEGEQRAVTLNGADVQPSLTSDGRPSFVIALPAQTPN